MQPTGGDMRRGAARRCGYVSVMLLAGTVFGTLGGASVSQAATTMSESHAPRIPLPGPGGIHAQTATNQWGARNWSGYAIDSGTYTSATGSWTVPTVIPPTKHTRKAFFSSTWVGIDGFNNQSLIQAGTEEDWIGGSAFYQAWWEILPFDETPISSVAVNPGDVMTVTITQGTPKWTITVTDTTSGQSFTTEQKYSGPMTSAEWIQEAPSVNGHVARLADDGTVEFDHCLANGANPAFTVADSGVMAKRGGRLVISTPSPPNPDGNGFAVAFGDVQPPPPPD
jgi:hypothetical protein